jgi:E3 ubiquitin-protein ligase MYCBP2
MREIQILLTPFLSFCLKTNRDIFFCGVGLFGGRGEYTARLKLFRVLDNNQPQQQQQQQQDGIIQQAQQCVELLAETDEVLYECATRETAILQLEKPIHVDRAQWHVIWVQITGPSSDCGAGGHAVVRAEADSEEEAAEDEEAVVEFHFCPNALSNNGWFIFEELNI